MFHPHGYRGGAGAILENFSAGRYFGVPLLAAYDMCVDPGVKGKPGAFPLMLRWLR